MNMPEITGQEYWLTYISWFHHFVYLGYKGILLNEISNLNLHQNVFQILEVSYEKDLVKVY